ncbi:acetylxylan esterase [Pontiella sulfatireligans]|uniref:Acetyl xylan esterase domain-containing protein n=1 Tax=Pontiella sulfatireligans TaxID=2750658 RepID=A0A6C2UIP2_9BACT|nr:acetylxylan esterase [Pontiella sulfatireligans]VGO19743.1 hypothetical protein SCARR_01802 [Pontiella sulfatireligans]
MNSVLSKMVAIVLMSGTTQAATIEWGGAAIIAGATDVNTSGRLEYAYHAGGTSAVTLNGVVFVAGGTDFGGDVTLGGTPVAFSNFGQNAAPFNTLSSDYQSLLDAGVYNNATVKTDPVTVTLTNLTAGQEYEVQFWANDSRNSAGRYLTLASGANTVDLDYNSTDVLGGVGQHVIGMFTADGTSQSFTVTPNVALAFNAIQVRNLTPVSDYQAELDTVLALGNLTNAPTLYTTNYVATTWAAVSAEIVSSGEAQPVLYEGLDYNGHPTRIFAWVGLPADLSEPVPAVVLAHGAGSGTAYKEWVDLWNARGYAAIAMDFNGKMSDTNAVATALPSYRGPVQDGRYDNSVTYPAVALTNHWMYHCVADVVLANSLLRSMPEVNEDHVGLMGVSWGGTITSTTIGIDTRLRFAVPTYGCGHLYDSYSLYSHLADCELYKQVWDPMVRIHRATMPVLWYSWPTDPHFPVDCQAETYLAMSGEHMVTLIPGMTHNHPAAWNREDSYTFANSIVSNGTPWCKQQSLELSNNVATVTFTSTKTLDGAELVSTKGTGYAGDLTWTQTSATLSSNGGGSWTVTATLPDDTTGWFVNVLSDTLVVSSDYQEIINLIPDQLELNHSIYANQSTGRVDVAFTAPTNVEIVEIRIGNQSHPGAITNVTVAPFVETNAYPATFPVWIGFDNTVAGLADGETASATLILVWHELDGSTDQVELPIQVAAYTTLHADVDIFATATANYGSNTVATMVSEVLTAPDGLATFQIAFDVTPMTAGSSVSSGNVTDQTTAQSWGIFAAGETDGALYTFDGDTAEVAEPIDNLQVTNFNAHGGSQTINDITGLSFKSIEIANGNHARDNVGVLVNSGVYENLGQLSREIYTIDLEGLSGVTPPVTNLAIKPMSTSGSNRFTVNSIKVKYTVAFSGSAYSTWASGYGLVDDDALPGADVENGGLGDGYDNLAEFALGMNPTNSDAGARESVGIAVEGGTNYFEYVHNRRSDYAAQDLSYLLIDSTNLVNSSSSTNAQDQIMVGSAVEGYEPVTNRYITDESSKFIELKIEQN